MRFRAALHAPFQLFMTAGLAPGPKRPGRTLRSPTHGTRTKSCDAPSAQPAPNRFKMAFRPRFWHVFASTTRNPPILR